MRRLLPLFVLAIVACDDKRATIADAAPTASTMPPPESPPIPTPTTPATPPSEIAAQHVLVAYKGAQRAPKSVTRSKADAKARADEVATKAKAGEDFTALVKQYSDDPEALSRLGSVGKFGRDKFDKAFTDAAFALKVGETSAPVESRFGFHVIKRNQ